jgi:hypothetical protein
MSEDNKMINVIINTVLEYFMINVIIYTVLGYFFFAVITVLIFILLLLKAPVIEPTEYEKKVFERLKKEYENEKE